MLRLGLWLELRLVQRLRLGLGPTLTKAGAGSEADKGLGRI